MQYQCREPLRDLECDRGSVVECSPHADRLGLSLDQHSNTVDTTRRWCGLEEADILPTCAFQARSDTLGDVARASVANVKSKPVDCSLLHSWCFREKIPPLFDEPYVKEIAAVHDKKSAQVLLRHAIQRGLVVLAKSTTPERVKSNFDVS